MPTKAPVARSPGVPALSSTALALHDDVASRVQGGHRWHPEVFATSGRHDVGEGMHELRHGTGDRELVVAFRPTDERIAIVAYAHRIAVVAPVRLDELVLALDVGHVGDEIDAAVDAVVSGASR